MPKFKSRSIQTSLKLTVPLKPRRKVRTQTGIQDRGKLSTCGSWHSRLSTVPLFSPGYYYVDGSLCCSNVCRQRDLSFSSSTAVPFLRPPLSSLFIRLDSKVSCLKGSVELSWRISLQFLLLFYLSLTLSPADRLSGAALYREIQFKKECSLNFIRARISDIKVARWSWIFLPVPI